MFEFTGLLGFLRGPVECTPKGVGVSLLFIESYYQKLFDADPFGWE